MIDNKRYKLYKLIKGHKILEELFWVLFLPYEFYYWRKKYTGNPDGNCPWCNRKNDIINDNIYKIEIDKHDIEYLKYYLSRSYMKETEDSSFNPLGDEMLNGSEDAIESFKVRNKWITILHNLSRSK